MLVAGCISLVVGLVGLLVIMFVPKKYDGALNGTINGMPMEAVVSSSLMAIGAIIIIVQVLDLK